MPLLISALASGRKVLDLTDAAVQWRILPSVYSAFQTVSRGELVDWLRPNCVHQIAVTGGRRVSSMTMKYALTS
ncbi:MAG: hypothetical protein QOG21_2261 [Actinomycetota bacterium]|nr:hypothetical protein [Actinomycetota bacterium]